MELCPEDLDFARYRTTGRPEALARVFDATAPRLLLLALHLARRGAEAEDLVQATFLAAMGAAESYDPSRPVLPWLAGILANEARMVGRRAARTPDPGRLPPPREPDPAEEAESREVTREVLQALEALPEPYRPVLILRLVHGLRAVQVAHALGRPPETIRTQARRGLKLLRAALPRGLAVGTLLGALEGRGLAAVRAAVLAGAGAPVGAGLAGGILVGGVVLMKKLALGLGLAAVGGVALLAFLGPWRGPSSRLPAVGPDAGTPPPLAAASRPAVENTAEQVSRTALPRTTEPAPPTLLKGRCLAAEDGTPLAGCELAVWARIFGWEQKEFEAKVWSPPAPATTAADGRFAIPLAIPPEPYGLGLRFRAAGRVPVAASWRHLEPGKAHDLGDVALVKGARVAGIVVDPQDAPLANVKLWAFVASPREVARFWPSGRYSAASGGDGTLSFPDLWPPGAYTLNIGDGYELLAGGELAVAPGADRVEFRAVVRRPDPAAVLAGIVVDEDGLPVAGAAIFATGQKGTASRTASTAEDGTFALSCTGDRSLPVGLHCTPPDAMRPYTTRWDYPWGTQDIRLVVPSLRRVAGFPLEVVAAGTGRAVTEFCLLLAKDSFTKSEWRMCQVRRLLAGHHPEGRADIPDLEPTPHFLVVVPKTEDLAPNPPLRLDPGSQSRGPLRVALDPPVALTVRVGLGDRRPVAGTQVELLQPLGEGQPGMAVGTVSLRPYDMTLMESINVGAFTWGRTATDAAGEARFSVTAGTGLAIRVLGPGHIPALVEGIVAREGAGPVEIVVSRGATLAGRVAPPAVLERLDPALQPGARRDLMGAPGDLRPGLVLMSPGGKRLAPPGKGAFPLAADGSFRIEGIPPGEWEAALFFWVAESGRGVCRGHDGRPPLARLSLLDGEVRELELDARAFLPGSVSGRILLEGRPVPAAAWTLLAAAGEGRGPTEVAGPPTDAQGRFHAPRVPPGACWLKVRTAAGDREETLYAEESFSINPGEEAVLDLSLRRAVLRIRLLAADGATPLPGRTLHLWSESLSREEVLRTDGEGGVLFAPAPPGEVKVRLREATEEEWQRLDWQGRQGRLLLLGTVRAEPGRPETQATLRLPPSARRQSG